MSAAQYAFPEDYAGQPDDLEFPPPETEEERQRRLQAMAVPQLDTAPPAVSNPAPWWSEVPSPDQIESAVPVAQGPVLQPGYESAMSEYEKALSTRPVATPPKWWQRGLGAVAGGLAGWSNAAGRTRTPINIDEMGESILHPGYAGKLQDWQSRVEPLKAKAGLEGQRQEAWWKGRAANAEEAYKGAQGEEMRQRGFYYQHRAELEQNQWKIGAGGVMYNTITGETKNAPVTPEDRYATAMAIPGTTPEMARHYALNGNLSNYREPATDKLKGPMNVPPGTTVYNPDTKEILYKAPDRPPKPTAGEKPPTRGQMAMIERNKLNDLDAAEKRATELRRANPDDTDAIMANLHVEQQRIQNAYESEIMTITERDTPHYQYPQYAPKPKPAEKQAAPVAAPSWLDRAKSLVGVGQPATAPAQQAAPATLRSAPKEGDVRQYQGATYTFDGTKWVR